MPLIITRTPYPKWWKDLQTAEIDFGIPGGNVVILSNPTRITYIATIALTVSKEANVTFDFGVFGPSGAMDFGGEDEPKGIVIAMGNSPISCGSGTFSVSASGHEGHCAGFVSYFQEPVAIQAPAG